LVNAFIPCFAKNGAKFGVVSADLLLEQKRVLGRSRELKPDTFCCFSMKTGQEWKRCLSGSRRNHARSMINASFQKIKNKNKKKRLIRRKRKKKKERK